MSATLKPYLLAVKRTLQAAMCLENFASQKVERYFRLDLFVVHLLELDALISLELKVFSICRRNIQHRSITFNSTS